MKHCLTFSGLFILATAGAQTTHEVQANRYRCIYHTADGRIDGNYVSYYPNGEKRAEGSFQNHQRCGTWTIWDSLGNIQVKREYKNSGQYNQWTPVQDSLGNGINRKRTCSYPASSNIIWEKRLWRFIPKERANEKLFTPGTFDKQIRRMVHKGMLTVYSGSNDQFAVPFEGWTADTAARLIGYRIKEDWYFDAAKSIMDVQIVGMAPVVQSTTNDTVNLCWIYYPDLKPLLAGAVISEMLQQRQFSSVIYKENNVYNRELKDYLPLPARNAEAEKIEIEMIENEHTLWVDTK